MAEPQTFQAEQLPVAERATERVESAVAASAESTEARQKSQTVAAPLPALPTFAPDAAPVADNIQKEVELVLSENIADIYKQLPADRKRKFKETGELLATQISGMIRGGLLQIKKILRMIREWLLIIPGVNRFFLEQEAKIKADKIQGLYERQHAPAA
ncbi:MAG: hypothetical protein A3C15_02555 [Candidatus Magasanikbacteria bacterium RIFCSPHIGHO2_02_FULL_50_9b]|uniref:Uncharacterized protein n=1 Tax=Candidatus Magasanikbacteria bacterium RIFCSPHIGHO2_02_FULL_50_9b TaxID=1798682 RepID=A0A1F6M7R5_9BACT|nr:MAG: hypothetical protein A3C15_02555 [Candidatus Magasanikbacteria bacterium RIFCSPHIGHO2_02_FULL_50_9b]